MRAARLAAAALLVSRPAVALDGNDALKVQLIGGVEVEGWYVRSGDGLIVLSGDNRFEEIPVAAIQAVERDGEPLSMERFRAELAAEQAVLDAFRADPPPHPHPAAVASMSMLWAGSGHAALGEWRSFAAYSVVEAVLLGTAAYNLIEGQNSAILVPLGAVDLVFKGWSAGEAARLARRRRARLDGGG